MLIYILRSEQIRDNARQALNAAPLGQTVEIKTGDKSKTGQQRNYWHMLLQILADWKGEDKEDVKLELKYKWLPHKEVVVDGTTYMHPISSEQMTREQYGEVIEKTQELLLLLGLKFPYPQDVGLNVFEKVKQ
jgi:hypothetical protein